MFVTLRILYVLHCIYSHVHSQFIYISIVLDFILVVAQLFALSREFDSRLEPRYKQMFPRDKVFSTFWPLTVLK